VTPTPISPGAASESAWAIEAVVELPVGQGGRSLAELDAHLPASPRGIATNSSNIVVSRLADATARLSSAANMHFFHPCW